MWETNLEILGLSQNQHLAHLQTISRGYNMDTTGAHQ